MLRLTGNNPERTGRKIEVDIAELLSDRPQQTAEPEVVHVPYIRCPHCGKEIDVFVKPREEQQA